ncbi:MAG: DUF935 family protein [Akkermansia sp.]|nr:DUF935 family protein [Akkermansia sp.]
MNKIVDYDAWQKLQLAPLTSFNPQVLQSLKYSQHSGYLLELERLYSTMYLEWPTLKKDASDMTEAVAGLTWTVAPFCQDGGEPDELAKEVAKVVSDALWMVSPQKPGEFSHCFTELLGSMVHALYRSVNVHEIVWKFTPELVFPLEYKQLGPQYYMWETRQGEPDRLMLVPDGMDYTRPVPFEPGRFVVALNTTGPDHPMYNADFYSLVGYFVAAKFGLPGLQSFVKRYGHPLRKFTVEDRRRREELEARLKAMPDVYDVFLGPGELLDVTAIPAGANVPHEVLLRVAENACHQLIKGNTLTSDVGDKGGSRAQAEVHMGVEASLVRKRGEFVARVLNRQLIPYIVQRNYGRTDLPMPELRCQVPEQKANIQKAQYWKEVLAIPGMRVLKSAVHDDLGLAVPGDGDEVYAAPEPTQGASSPAASTPTQGGDVPSMGDDALDVTMAGRVSAGGSLRERAERLLPVAMRKWAGPTIERFESMLRAGRKPEEILARLEELRPNTRALADAMSAVTEAGLGVQGDAVSAENPYGCNQYGEGWSEPHDGSSTERIGKDKLLTKKDADGNVRQIATKKRYPGKAAYLGVGKDGKKGEEPEPKPEAKKPEPKPEPKKKEKPEPEPKPKAPEKKPKVEKKEPEPDNAPQKRYFEPATTLAQARRNTASLVSGTKVSWGRSVPLEVQNEYNEVMAGLLDKYPVDIRIAQLGSYFSSDLREGARCRWRPDSTDVVEAYLQINHDKEIGGLHMFKYWKPYETPKDGFARSNVGVSPEGVSVRAVMTHEYGHALHARVRALHSHAYMFRNVPGVGEARYAQQSVSDAYWKAKNSGDIKSISRYANTSEAEFFAECFAARELGENLPDYVNNMLDKVIKCAIKKS